MTIFNRSAVERPVPRQLNAEGLAPDRHPPPIEDRHRPSMRQAEDYDADMGRLVAPSSPALGLADNPDSGEVVLSKAYMAHGEPVQRFQLRKPVAREIKQCGNPLKPVLDDAGRISDVEVKWDVIVQYVPLLSNPPIPPSTVDQFEFWDLDACASVLAPFFIRLSRSVTS